MNEQLIICVAVVGLAASYLLWRIARAVGGLRKGGCGGSCGCASKPGKTSEIKLIAPEELLIRKR